MSNISKSFLSLKNKRQDTFNKLSVDLEKTNSKFKQDERFWQPTVDKNGVGHAIIRFLPTVSTEEIPYVRFWNHAFKGPTGNWYIEKSLMSIGLNDPVSEFNTRLWNANEDDDSPERKQARKQKRKLVFISNILIVNDPGNPANNGRVALFKYGKKIFEKINEVMFPKFPDEPRINPFDLWEGANFRLKITKEDGYRSYNSSKFDNPGPLAKTDEELAKVYDQVFPLQPFIAPEEFKSYDELKARLYKVLGINQPRDLPESEPRKIKETKLEVDDDLPTNSAPPWEDDEDDDGDTLEKFRKLANGE